MPIDFLLLSGGRNLSPLWVQESFPSINSILKDEEKNKDRWYTFHIFFFFLFVSPYSFLFLFSSITRSFWDIHLGCCYWCWWSEFVSWTDNVKEWKAVTGISFVGGTGKGEKKGARTKKMNVFHSGWMAESFTPFPSSRSKHSRRQKILFGEHFGLR